MREIKFRIWDIKRKQHSNIITNKTDIMVALDKNDVSLVRYSKERILEQYIGLKDENGVEIYENDVVELDLNNLGIKKCVVRWHNHNASWYFDNPKQNYFMEDIAHIQKHIKVIGIIHEK